MGRRHYPVVPLGDVMTKHERDTTIVVTLYAGLWLAFILSKVI